MAIKNVDFGIIHILKALRLPDFPDKPKAHAKAQAFTDLFFENRFLKISQVLRMLRINSKRCYFYMFIVFLYDIVYCVCTGY